MKRVFGLMAICVVLTGCMEQKIINNYSLEKYNGSEVPVCVNYPKRVKVVRPGYMAMGTCGNFRVPDEYEELDGECDALMPEVVSYSYCLAELPKPVHLVEKQEKDMTICYDRNNKVELPISYCQKDINVYQSTNVTTRVTQATAFVW